MYWEYQNKGSKMISIGKKNVFSGLQKQKFWGPLRNQVKEEIDQALTAKREVVDYKFSMMG